MNPEENKPDTEAVITPVIGGSQRQDLLRSKKSAIAFFLIFAVIGAVFWLRSFAATPDMLFTATSLPAVSDASDSQSVEVGVKFQSDVAGTVSGIRFYKGTSNTGTHEGDLWSASGTKLASATFTNETASGWQEVDFTTPVQIQANTTYVASYFAPNGGYAYTYGGLTSELNTLPLHALADGTSGPNGVYVYSSTPAFPTNGYRASNYWVDVMFEPKTATPATPPQVTITSPTSAAKVSGLVTITGTASDSISVTGVQLSIDGAAAIPLQITAGKQATWSYSLDTSKLTTGIHTLKATATNSSNLSTSTTSTFTVSAPAPAALAVDAQVSTHQTKAATTIATPAFSTKYSNELLTAFITSDGPNGSEKQSFSQVTGAGLTWTLKARKNTQSGVSEIWQAVAPSPLTAATITATRAKGSYIGSFVLISFVNASTGTAESAATASKSTGAPTVSIAAPAGAWVWAVGNDYSHSQARTAGTGQTIVDQYLATTVDDTYWVQSGTTPVTGAGNVSINDTTPTNDQWNLAAIAILPSSAGSTTGTITPPTAPSNITATAASDSQVNLSWTAGTDPSSTTLTYTVYRDGTQVSTTTSPSFVDHSLSPNTTYTYYVTASDPSGNVSSPSSTVSVLTPAALDTTPPTAPTTVHATAASATQVNLTWNASTDTASAISKYLVLRNGVVVATASAPTTAYSDTSVAANTSYSYQIEAQDTAGNTSALSTAVTVKTPNPTDTTPPSVPANVAAVAVSDSQVNLSWNASTDNIGVAGYTVYRNGTKLGTTTTTSYGDATVSAGTSYNYSVSAYDGAGNQSAQSTSVSVTTPGAASGSLPTGVSLQAIDGGPAYFSQWSNGFPSSSSFVPIGVYPAEGQPSVLASEGINFFTPSRDDNNGTWCPVWSNPNGNDMTHVNGTPGFYAGGTFYQTLNGEAWGSQAAFNVFGDELDGNAGNFFDCLPSNITSNNKAGSWGGLSAASFEGAEAASKSDDPTRPTYIQTTTTFIDGGKNYFYTEAEKQAICTGADIFSFDIYPIVLRGGSVSDMYDEVQEARGDCLDSRPVMAFTEIDHMNGGNIYPQPAQTTAEVWNAIIAGARGVQYFDQYGTIDNPTYTGNGNYAAGAMYNAVKNTNAQIDTLAPVINSPFANGYVTSSGSMSIMTKYYNNHFYIFAIPHAAGAQTITFKLAGNPNTTATVLNENRSITVSEGSFTDTFANENTVHIYEIN
jgi:chitodextrinase